MQERARTLLRRDIIPDVTGPDTLNQQVSDEVAELLLRSGQVFISMQEGLSSLAWRSC